MSTTAASLPGNLPSSQFSSHFIDAPEGRNMARILRSPSGNHLVAFDCRNERELQLPDGFTADQLRGLSTTHTAVIREGRVTFVPIPQSTEAAQLDSNAAVISDASTVQIESRPWTVWNLVFGRTQSAAAGENAATTLPETQQQQSRWQCVIA